MANHNAKVTKQNLLNPNGTDSLANFNREDTYDLFTKLAPLYYQKNFGTASKTQFDLLMFHCYIGNLYKKHTKNNIIDYSEITDYKISKDLGITQSRVRNLKIKDQLEYPREIDWVFVFPQLEKNWRYDATTQKVIISIPDPNIQIEMTESIESEGGYVETQLNRKILQIRVEYYIDLLVRQIHDSLSSQNVSENKLRKQLLKKSKAMFALKDKEEIGLKNIDTTFLEKASNVSSLIALVNSVIGLPGVNAATSVVKNGCTLLNALLKKI